MLANGKHEGVVNRKPGALGLYHVEIMALSVGGGMSKEKIIRRVHSRMADWERECKGMWYVLV